MPPDGNKEIKCTYCGNTIIVPKELRSSAAPLPRTKPADTAQTLILVVVVGIIFLLLGIFVWKPMLDSSGNISKSLDQANATEAVLATVMVQEANGIKSTETANSKGLQPLLTFGGTGTAPGLFQEATHVAVDGSGSIYVADAKTKRIQKFDAAGKYLNLWVANDPEANPVVSTIEFLKADHAGNVYVTANGKIYKYDGATGKLLQTITGHNYWSAIPLVDGGIIATATSQTDDDLVRLDANGKELWYKHGIISSQPGGKAPFRLSIAVDGLGNIFALQNDQGAIYKYTPDGQFATKFGSKGGQPGQFNADGIRYIAVDNQSNVYVSDFSDLYIFDANGRYLKTFDAFDGIGGAPRDMVITAKNELYIVQDDNKIYQLPPVAP